MARTKTRDTLALPIYGAGQNPDVSKSNAALLSLADSIDSLSTSGVALATEGLVATLRRGQRSCCFGVHGDSTGDNLLVGAGTAVDEWTLVFAKRLAQDYPGYTLLERRWNDGNQGYDAPIKWQTGTINGGAPRGAAFTVAAPGAMQYTGTSAITGDIDVRVQVTPLDWTPSGDMTLASRWDATGNGRSFLFLLKTTGALGFNWSTSGSSSVGEKDSTAVLGATVTDGQPYWVRVTMDVDNGASGNDLKFYSSPDGVTWTQLGSTVTTATATSLFGGTAPYQIGTFNGTGLSSPIGGTVNWVDIRAGLTSQQSVVAPLPDDWDIISAETTVSFVGAPVLMFLNGSTSGKNLSYIDDSTRRPILNQPHGQNVIFINTSHNDQLISRQTWLTNYAAAVGHIQTLVPYVPIIAVGQNPVGIGGSFSITEQGLELRAARGAILGQYAAATAGVYFFDAWPLLVAAQTVDQLHPTSGLGSGSEAWGLTVYAQVAR